jgi:cell wall-associated NlpC family hydrolase
MYYQLLRKLAEDNKVKKYNKSFMLALSFSLCVIVFTAAPVKIYASPLTDVLSQVAAGTTSNSAPSGNLISILLNALFGNLLSPLQNNTTNTTNTTNTLSNPSSSTGAPNASQTDTQNAIISTAQKYMGVPYVWGGTTTDGFDCSGFTQYVMQQNGISLPRTAAEQFAVGTPVDKENLQTGDLVFFTTYKPGASHVGIYMGDGNFINASSSAKKVTITALNGTYYVEHYIGARRYTKGNSYL